MTERKREKEEGKNEGGRKDEGWKEGRNDEDRVYSECGGRNQVRRC